MLTDFFQRRVYDKNDTEAKIFLLEYCLNDVSFRFLGRKLEVVFLHDCPVVLSQPTERKRKNLGSIGLDIKTDLREFDKQSSSRRTSESLRAMMLEQHKGTSNNSPMKLSQLFSTTNLNQSHKFNERSGKSEVKKYQKQRSKTEASPNVYILEQKSLIIVNLKTEKFF
jgi:hypothetical protein